MWLSLLTFCFKISLVQLTLLLFHKNLAILLSTSKNFGDLIRKVINHNKFKIITFLHYWGLPDTCHVIPSFIFSKPTEKQNKTYTYSNTPYLWCIWPKTSSRRLKPWIVLNSICTIFFSYTYKTVIKFNTFSILTSHSSVAITLAVWSTKAKPARISFFLLHNFMDGRFILTMDFGNLSIWFFTFLKPKT